LRIVLARSLVLPVAVMLTGCGSATTHPARARPEPGFCSVAHVLDTCVVADHGRFVVAVDRPLISAARKVGVSLTSNLTRSLDLVGRLLPGPVTDIQLV
jgi:hypothetical protein